MTNWKKTFLVTGIVLKADESELYVDTTKFVREEEAMIF